MDTKKIALIFVFLLIICSFSSVAIKIDKEKMSTNNSNKKSNYICGSFKKEMDIKNNTFEILGEPPEKWDWRNANYKGVSGDYTTPIRDQGRCGACWAFGPIAALESIIKIRKHNPDLEIDLSEQYMISCGDFRFLLTQGCCGALFMSGLDFLTVFGTINESCFKYKAVDYRGRDFYDCLFESSHQPIRCFQKCKCWRQQIIKIKDYHYISNQKSMKNALVNYGPLVSFMTVYEDYYDYENGIYHHTEGSSLGGHCVCIVGYDDTQECWICKNSWGTDWGENGWFRIGYGECDIDDGGNVIYIENIKTRQTGITANKSYVMETNFIEDLLFFYKQYSQSCNICNM